MLRLAIVVAGMVFMGGAAVLFVVNGPLIGVIYLGASGVLIVSGILFARDRYRPKGDRGHGR